MSLSGAVDALTSGERARYSGPLDIAAYFDGWNQASGGPARWFPRFLTRGEEEAWRDGWNEAKAERAVYGDSLLAQESAKVLQFRPRPDACTRCPIVNALQAAA